MALQTLIPCRVDLSTVALAALDDIAASDAKPRPVFHFEVSFGGIHEREGGVLIRRPFLGMALDLSCQFLREGLCFGFPDKLLLARHFV